MNGINLIFSGSHGYTPIFKKKANFIEYFERFATEHKSSTNYFNALVHLRKFTGGTIKFLHINERWLDEFKAYLLEKVSNNSSNTYYTALKTVLKKAVREKILQENTAQYTDSIKTTDVERVYLTHEELTKLSRAKCPNDEVKRAFLFACYTGLRFSDLNQLTWEKIKTDNGRYQLQYRQKKTGGFP
jgi:integrase/recombinase XerD